MIIACDMGDLCDMGDMGDMGATTTKTNVAPRNIFDRQIVLNLIIDTTMS